MPSGTQDSYLVQRANTWHYRRRVPADVQAVVGVKWWKKSLKTSSQREAESKARKLGSVHDLLIAQVRGLSLPDKRAALEEVIGIARDELIADPSDEAAKGIYTRAVEAAEKIKRAMLAAAEQRLDTLPEVERDAVKAIGGIEAFFQQATGDVVAFQNDKLDYDIKAAFGRVTPRKADEVTAVLTARARHVAKDRNILEKLGLDAGAAAEDTPDNPLIMSAMEAWFKDRAQGHYAVKRHRISINRFIGLHGNVPVASVTKAMCRDYVEAIRNLPDHRRLPAEMRGGLVDPGTDIPRVSAPTVERHLSSLKALMKFCVERDWIAVNPATGLKGPPDTRKKADKRRPFTRAERNQLLARTIEEYGDSGDMTWLVKLGAYTGARLEELAQLARTNVRQVEGAWVIEIDDLDGRHVKSGSSVRMVPLHKAIRDDFVAWAHSGAGTRVFTSFEADKHGRFANAVSGDFARLMDRAGLEDRSLVFHSLRHTLKREMSNARVDPDVRRALLGHTGKDAHDGYAGHSLEALAAELDRMGALFD